MGGNWAIPLHRKGKLSAKKSQRNCGWQNERQFWVYLEELYRFLSQQFLPIGFKQPGASSEIHSCKKHKNHCSEQVNEHLSEQGTQEMGEKKERCLV